MLIFGVIIIVVIIVGVTVYLGVREDKVEENRKEDKK